MLGLRFNHKGHKERTAKNTKLLLTKKTIVNLVQNLCVLCG
jgi:hypothetical protein